MAPANPLAQFPPRGKNRFEGLDCPQMGVYSRRPKPKESIPAEEEKTDASPWEPNPNGNGGSIAVCMRPLEQRCGVCRQRSGSGQECIRGSAFRSLREIVESRETSDVHARQSGARPLHNEQPAAGKL